MERKAEDIFRLKNFAVLKSPLAAAAVGTTINSSSIPSPSPLSTSVNHHVNFNLSSPAPPRSNQVVSSLNSPLPISFLGTSVPLVPVKTLSEVTIPKKGEQSTLPTKEQLSKVVSSITNNKLSSASSRRTKYNYSELMNPNENITRDNPSKALQANLLLKEKISGMLKEREIVDDFESSSDAKGNDLSSHNGKEITLCDWSLVLVSNNPIITKIDKSITSQWIIIVGKRKDTLEKWHSSLITGIESSTKLFTGSGTLYKLEGLLNENAMKETQMSPSIISAFKFGFPNDWKKLLINELATDQEGGVESLRVENLKKQQPLSDKTNRSSTFTIDSDPCTSRNSNDTLNDKFSKEETKEAVTTKLGEGKFMTVSMIHRTVPVNQKYHTPVKLKRKSSPIVFRWNKDKPEFDEGGDSSIKKKSHLWKNNYLRPLDCDSPPISVLAKRNYTTKNLR